jgi:diguanylate cyclase (GGDEF)-like protein/PAS domain S-box-containing protein
VTPRKGGAGDTHVREALDTGRLGYLLTHVSEAVLGIDHEGSVVFASPAVRELTGFDPESVVGHSVLDFVHPDERDDAVERLGRWVGRTGATAGPTVRTRHAAGGWVDLAVEALTGDEVEPFAAVLTLRPAGENADDAIELHRRLVNEDRLTRLASSFVHLPSFRVEEGIDKALAEMGGLEGVDRVCLVTVDETAQRYRHTHEWCAPGIQSLRDEYAEGEFPDNSLMRSLRRFESVHIPRVADLAGDWTGEREFLTMRGVQSVLAVPLVEGARFAGFVSCEAVREDRDWDSHHIATLRSAAGIIAQALARRRAEQQLEHQAHHDSLTGLGNRWDFLEHLAGALEALPSGASTSPSGVAVLLFDLDRFKVVNDSLGHTAGDRLLAEVANRLDSARSPDQTVARLGGDELVVLVPRAEGPQEAAELARTIQRKIARPVDVDGHETFVSVSVGVGFTDEPSTAAEDLLRDADAAMYVAKARGRDRVEIFDEALRTQMRERLRWENELRRAIAQARLTVHYQPEFVLGTNEIVGAEALVRWQHPDRGLLAAAEFIEIAEETGTILEIGAWVLGEACRQLGRWLEVRPERELVMRVNLSARQVAQPDLVPVVVEAVEKASIPPSALCLEITETTLMADAEVSLAVLEKLRGLGVSLAIDDFGTGYSSLSYLKRFPVSVVKVDRSFVDGLGSDLDDTAIVSAIVGMARSLGLDVTAEGVETDVQVDELLRLGCTHAQGFLLGRPVPAGEFWKPQR